MKTLLIPMALTAVAVSFAVVSPSKTKPLTTPVGTLRSAVNALHDDDLLTFIQLVVPPDEIDRARAEWEQARQQPVPQAESDKFRAGMVQLTAVGAEEALVGKALPNLKQLEPELEMLAGMITGIGQAAIKGSPDLSDTEKQQAMKAVEAFGLLFSESGITDEGKLVQAVAILCQTARDLGVKEIEDFQRLSIEELVGKGNGVLRGLKDILAVYGIQVDRFLETITFETIWSEGDRAIVRMGFSLLGQHETIEIRLRRIDERWWREKFDPEQAGGGHGYPANPGAAIGLDPTRR